MPTQDFPTEDISPYSTGLPTAMFTRGVKFKSVSLPMPDQHPVSPPASFITCGSDGDQGSPRTKRKSICHQRPGQRAAECSDINYGSESESGHVFATRAWAW